jgi:type IV pilus assembly protein PilA
MSKERGFSMLELLIVVAIITLIAAIAIPNLRKARQSANTASAVQSLRTITTAEHLYKSKFQQYGTLAEIAPEGTLDSVLSSGTKSAYNFAIAVTTTPEGFTVNATPLESPTTLSHFFVDETAVIRFNEGAAADATSPPIPR